MTAIDWKLSSWKLWTAAAGIVTSLAIAFGPDENIISTVAGAVVSAASAAAYIMAGGKTDAGSAGNAAQGRIGKTNGAGGTAILDAKKEVMSGNG